MANKEARTSYLTITLRPSEDDELARVSETQGMSKSSWGRQQIILALAKIKKGLAK